MAAVTMEWDDDWGSVGWHEGWEQTCDTIPQAHFPWKFGSWCNEHDENGWSICQWKTHGCTQSVVQCWRIRVQRTSRFSIWDPTVVSWFLCTATLAKQWGKLPKDVVCELGRKKTAHSSLHRRHHLFQLEQRSYVRKRVWQSIALVKSNENSETQIWAIGDYIEPTLKRHV